MTEIVRSDAEFDALVNPFAAAFRATRMAMVVTDPRRPDNPIVFANQAFLDLTGYALEEVLNRNCRFLQCDDTDRTEVARIHEAVIDGRPVAAEILNVRKNGTRFWNSLVVSPVMDASGGPAFFFGSQLDVSDRRETERRLREANEVLEDARTRLADEVTERTMALTLALEEKTALLHELDHRVKNNVQMLTALLGLEARETNDPTLRVALKRVRGRLQVLGAVHRKSYVSDGLFDMGAYLTDLSDEYALGEGTGFVIEDMPAERVLIPANKAAAAALLLHELFVQPAQDQRAQDQTAPNASAGPPLAGRPVMVRLQKANGHLVVDLGFADGANPPNSSFLPLLIARQLKGSLERTTRNGTTALRVALPIDPEGQA